MSSLDGGRNRARAAAGALIIGVVQILLGCTPAPPKPETATVSAPPPSSRPGGYYKDDGPGENPPANLDAIAEPAPRVEPLNRFANRPYSVFGREYVPATSLRPYKERGIASWYGRKFHNQKTSTGETYDMYAMTAAHPTLPLPSYARVTNLANGKSVVVRVNDRGPFHAGRIVDLSYAAAWRIGIAQKGSGEVEVESIVPSGAPVNVAAQPLPPVASAPSIAPAALVSQETSGYVVQLGAFANNANAQAFIAHLANQTAGLGVEAKVHQADGLFRVVVGPYPTREEAGKASERLRVALGLENMVKAQ
ncbi:MAG TPA: septal ring lytic transglycosylase RlpA family protein [Casimicrobiaceae bacterium]